MPGPFDPSKMPFPDRPPLDPAEIERQAAQAKAAAAAAPPNQGGSAIDGIAEVAEAGTDLLGAATDGGVEAAVEVGGEFLSGALEALGSGGEVLGGCAEGCSVGAAIIVLLASAGVAWAYGMF